MELRFVKYLLVHSHPCCRGEGPRTKLTILSGPLVLLGVHYRSALFGRLSFIIFSLYQRRVVFFCSIRALWLEERRYWFLLWLAEGIFLPSNLSAFDILGFVILIFSHTVSWWVD